MPTWRHELKYFISWADYVIIRDLIMHVLRPDASGDEQGNYFVRSLYFDDAYNAALMDKIAGVQHRSKYRIRTYNMSTTAIRLERKRKNGSMISKDSVVLSRDLCDQLCAGDVDGWQMQPSELMRDIYRQVKTRLLAPVVIVDYLREAYVHPAENIRITFDKHLRTGLRGYDLFDPRLPTVPALEAASVILEVKYDRYIPPYIKALLSRGNAQPSAISKYVMCRNFE